MYLLFFQYIVVSAHIPILIVLFRRTIESDNH